MRPRLIEIVPIGPDIVRWRIAAWMATAKTPWYVGRVVVRVEGVASAGPNGEAPRVLRVARSAPPLAQRGERCRRSDIV